MAWISLPLLALLAGLHMQWALNPDVVIVQAQAIPAQAQIVDQRKFNVWPTDVPPVTVANGTQVFMPPGVTPAELLAKPFHIYDDEFYSIIGENPTLTLLAEEATNPLYHEAVVWHEPTDEVFFVQNAGAVAAGTGLNKSGIIQKISLPEADAVKDVANATGKVTVTVVPSNPTIINPNGAANYRGQIVYMAEGAGPGNTSSVVLMNPRAPYNTTVLLNNYFGRQFSSLNDAVVHPVNKDLYFTDTLYGYLQDFRPPPGLRNQVYRWNDKTGAVTVVADGFVLPNGLTFAPNAKVAYVTDTGTNQGFRGWDFSQPASIYQFDVNDDGTWHNRRTFAFVDSGVPDGVHCDSKGYVYAACGDGVHVWNPAGTLIGKIYLGTTSANFQLAGHGRMVLMGETKLFYATVANTTQPNLVKGQ